MQTICGVDISKNWLDAHVEPQGEAARFANDAEGIAALAALCRRTGVALVAMEATGGYERSAFLLLWQAGIAPKAVINLLGQLLLGCALQFAGYRVGQQM